MLHKYDLTIVRTGGGEATGSFVKGYISAKKTLLDAEREGLSVCDYVEKLWEAQGDTQRVIEHMLQYGALTAESPKIVEIGTGTGRYLEKILQSCNPAKYESYETAKDWSEWLQSRYPIISQEADGCSLKQTPSRSADLVHAHGLFVYLPFFASYRYWMEIWRVTKEGGVVVFDIISLGCLEEKELNKWLDSGDNYPCFFLRILLFLVLVNSDFY